MLDPGPSGGGGSIDVSPAELQSAGSTIRGASAELDGQGGLSVGDVGYPQLHAAITAFCRLALSTASTFSYTVEQAGQNASSGGAEYEQTEWANAAGLRGL
jgi:hypothetical protein